MKRPNEQGMYEDIRFEEYLHWEALDQTLLKKMQTSPKHLRYHETHPSPVSEAMVVGDAAHAAILQPDRYEKDYTTVPIWYREDDLSVPLHRNSNAYKAKYAEWFAGHQDSVIITESQDADIKRWAEAIKGHEEANAILHEGKGLVEQSLLWKDEETGLWLKARLDRITKHKWPVGVRTTIVDLKTARRIVQHEWEYDLTKYGYDIQAEFYRMGAAEVAGDADRVFCFVVVKKDEEMDVVVYVPDDDALFTAAGQIREWLNKYAECKENGYWPGISATPLVFGSKRRM